MPQVPKAGNSTAPEPSVAGSPSANASERQTPPTALKGQISTTNAAPHDFHLTFDQQGLPVTQDADAYDASDNFDESDQSLNLNLPSNIPAKSHPFHFDQTRRYSQNAFPAIPNSTFSYREDVHAAAKLDRSATPHMKRHKAVALGYAEKSPYARMNNATLGPDLQRRFFHERAEKHGYKLAADEDKLPNAENDEKCTPGEIKDEALHRQWGSLQTGRTSPQEFYGARANQTREQRIAFALNLARIIAREASDPVRDVESHTLSSQNSKVSSLAMALSRLTTPVPIMSPTLQDIQEGTPDTFYNPVTPNVDDSSSGSDAIELNLNNIAINYANRGKSEDSLASTVSLQSQADNTEAELNDAKALRDANQSILSDVGINAGIVFLSDFLAPPVKSDGQSADQNEDHFNGLGNEKHRSSWTPCKSWEETNRITNLFVKTCDSYNALADQRIKATENQNHKMSDSMLPRLAVPVELRGGARADEIRTQAAQDFSLGKGWSSPDGWRDFVKFAGAILGTVLGFGLPLLSSRWNDFFWSRFSQSYRVQQMEAHANFAQTQALRNLNRKEAEEWVLKQAKRPEAPLASGRDHLSPGGHNLIQLAAAFANQTREQLVEEVQAQLELSVEGDILAETEKQAEKYGSFVKDPRINVPDKDYLLDPDFLHEMAEGIVDGLTSGLQQAEPRIEPLDHPRLENVPSGVVAGTARGNDD